MGKTASHPPPGLRERKKQQARTAMTEAALELFWSGGYATTTLEDVIDQADVSMRTFFRYFDSKQAVALAAEQELWDALLAEVDNAQLDGTVLEMLQRSLLGALKSLDDDWDRRFITSRGIAATAPALFDASDLATLQAQRQIVEILEGRLGIDSRNDVRLRLICDMAMSAWRTSAQSWVRRGRRRRVQSPRPAPRSTLVQLVEESFTALRPSLDLSA